MANKQEKTIEQRLEEALVFYEKMPYKLPSNWCWVKLPVLYENLTSSDKKIPQKNYLREGLYSIIDQGKELIGGYTNEKKYLYDGELPVVIFGDHTRAVKYVDFVFAQGADGVKVLKPSRCILPKYLYYCIKNLNIVDLGYRRHFPLFPQYFAPLAPMEEQKRIVEVIEKQFVKLDEAYDLIKKSLDTCADRKSAILHEAFTGELTKKWRMQRSCCNNSNEVELGQLLYPMETKKPNAQDKYFYYIDIDAIDNQYQCVSTPKKLLVKDAPSRAARGLRENDIIFSMVRPYLRNIAYITSTLAHCIASTGFYVCRCKKELSPRFLFYYLCNQELLDYLTEHYMRGDNSPSIRKEDLLGLKLKLPSIDEQEEIVRILDSIFEKEDQSKELISMLDKIDEIKKSILARAFRGKLSTSNPNDESAIELLKRIIVNR